MKKVIWIVLIIICIAGAAILFMINQNPKETSEKLAVKSASNLSIPEKSNYNKPETEVKVQKENKPEKQETNESKVENVENVSNKLISASNNVSDNFTVTNKQDNFTETKNINKKDNFSTIGNSNNKDNITVTKTIKTISQPDNLTTNFENKTKSAYQKRAPKNGEITFTVNKEIDINTVFSNYKISAVSKDHFKNIQNILLNKKRKKRKRGKGGKVSYKIPIQSNKILEVISPNFTGNFQKDVVTYFKNIDITLKDSAAVFNFDFDVYNKVIEAQKDKFQSFIKKILNNSCYISQIIIVGYTDSIGTDIYNLNLSVNRTKFVKKYLQEKMKGKLMLIGAGETNPISSNSTDKGRAKNRRVEIFLKLKK